MSRGVEWDERFDRLPKWAQGKVTTLLCRVEEAEANAETLRQATDPDTSRAVLADYSHGDRGIPVEQYRRIKLYTGPRDKVGEDECIELTLHDGFIEVHAGWSFDLAVKPRSGNVIRLFNAR